VQRLRQAEPSWFRSGQTTTLFSSFTENEPVNGARGGIASIEKSISSAEPCTRSRVGYLAVNGSCEAMKHLYEARRELQVLYQNSDGSVSSVSELAEAWNCSGGRLWRLRGAESMSSAGSRAISPSAGNSDSDETQGQPIWLCAMQVKVNWYAIRVALLSGKLSRCFCCPYLDRACVSPLIQLKSSALCRLLIGHNRA
jgi:hypothetical protein